jgi:hypothetical protein
VHCASLEQVAPHALPLHHEYGAHEVCPLLRQAPLPLQSCAFVTTPAEQVADAHSWSGSLPSTMLPHVPSAPAPFFAAEHAWQLVLHAVLQHTPSTQFPDEHWFAAVQATPFAYFATQPVPEQK